MASRKLVLGSEEISANETASSLAGCSLFCMENPEGWTFQSDSRGAAELKFTVRVRGDTDNELETRLAALVAELRYIVGKEIKLVARTGNVRYQLPLTNWPSFYGRYDFRDGGEDGAVLVDCVMTCDAIGDGSDPDGSGQIGTTVWTIHLAAGGLVTAQGQGVFSGLESAEDYIKALAEGTATLPSWMGADFKFFDAQLDVREGTFAAGVGVPVHVEMRQKQAGPSFSGFDYIKDWEYALTRVETAPYVPLEGAPAQRPPVLANLSGSFQYRTQSAGSLDVDGGNKIEPKDIFKAADNALNALIDWIQSAQATVIEVPGARKLTPSFPNSQVAFETVLAILGGPNDPNFIRWQESISYDVESENSKIITYKGVRRLLPGAGLDYTMQHKFLCESLTPQPYLAPLSPPGRWVFSRGKIPKPAKNVGMKTLRGKPTYVTDGETTWFRISADNNDIAANIPELGSGRFTIDGDAIALAQG